MANNIIPVEVAYNLGKIENNLDLVARSVEEFCESYKTVVVTEETVKDGKQMLANLRKAKKILDDERKDIKKAWEKPFKDFEKKCKEVIALYDEPINIINEQVQELEEQRKEEKRAEIAKLFLSIETPEEIKGWYRLDDIYNSIWENATYKFDDIKKEIMDFYASAIMNYSSIKSMKHKYEAEGLEVLKKSNSLTDALAMMASLLMQEEKIKAKEQVTITGDPVEAPAPPVEELPFGKPVEHMNVDLEIRKSDFEKLVKLLDDSGIYYHIW